MMTMCGQHTGVPLLQGFRLARIPKDFRVPDNRVGLSMTDVQRLPLGLLLGERRFDLS